MVMELKFPYTIPAEILEVVWIFKGCSGLYERPFSLTATSSVLSVIIPSVKGSNSSLTVALEPAGTHPRGTVL